MPARLRGPCGRPRLATKRRARLAHDRGTFGYLGGTLGYPPGTLGYPPTYRVIPPTVPAGSRLRTRRLSGGIVSFPRKHTRVLPEHGEVPSRCGRTRRRLRSGHSDACFFRFNVAFALRAPAP